MSHDDLPLFAEQAPQVKPQATMICDDVLAWAKTYDGPKFHALCSDPPFSLQFMSKPWDNDIALRADTWKTIAQYLLPGAFGFVFGSSRLYHRLGCALEDAGLRLLPSIFLWLTGSSFPKATRIPDDRFDGHRYGGQVLKDSASPILVFQVPYQGSARASITQTGAGALWIEGGRISTDWATDPTRRGWQGGNASESWDGGLIGPYGKAAGRERRTHPQASGRWPANFCLSHLDTCVRVGERQVKSESGGTVGTHHNGKQGYGGNSQDFVTMSAYKDATGHETVAEFRCAPGCPVHALDLQAGERKGPGGYCDPEKPFNSHAWPMPKRSTQQYPGETGGPSRFFHVSDFSLDVAERLAQESPVGYYAKASRRERDAGLEGMPTQRHHVTQRTQVYQCGCGNKSLGRHWPICPKCGRDMREGSLIDRNGLTSRNNHPTIKPLKLCQWLATLLLPPEAYSPRRILCPFSGSGSEGIGAMLAGWEEIVMVDSEQSYVDIARQRVAYWQQRGRL